MGFINDFKTAWEDGKQEARLEVVREFFAYIFNVKYKDAIENAEWYPSQYQDIYDAIEFKGSTVPLREKKELLLDFLEFVTEIMPRNKIEMDKIDDSIVQEIINRI